MTPIGDPRIIFIRPPVSREQRRTNDRTSYARAIRRQKRACGRGLKAYMHDLVMRGDADAKQWFENKRRTG